MGLNPIHRLAAPIVVDLDGTLLLGDTLDESVAGLLFSRPLQLIATGTALLKGRSAFKHALAGSFDLNVEALPAREPLVAWLKERHLEGVPIHLVTAADQSIADKAAARFGFFQSAIGSTPGRNLKGRVKRDFLNEQFPDGFVYCGDSHADIPIFAAARGAVLCDVSSAAAAGRTPVLARFDAPPTLHDLLRAFRVHQWSKNLLIFVPLALGHVYGDPIAVMRACAGFVIVSVLASASYLTNDLADLAADRRHRSKCHRGFASGRLSLRLGFVSAPLLTLLAFAAAWALGPPFAACLLAYFVLTTLYSWRLKRIPLLDVFVIGSLFATRLAMGVALLGLTQSVWLLSFSMFLFFSLALAKRHVEIMAAVNGEAASIASRGYRPSDWPVTLVLGCGAGLVSVLIMLLYMTADASPSGFYPHLHWLFVIPGALTVWIMRIWLLSHRGELDDDPVVFALKDKVSIALGVAIAIAFVIAV
jgi:4-hydroxybenzoate polyprenyltransferase